MPVALLFHSLRVAYLRVARTLSIPRLNLDQSFPLLGVDDDHDAELGTLDGQEKTNAGHLGPCCRHIIEQASTYRIAWCALAALSWLLNLWLRFCYALIPQIIRTHVFNDPLPSRQLGQTSWLDGLRGTGALFVFNFHFITAYSDMSVVPWGLDDDHKWFFELPIIRIIYAGYPAVCIWFLVGGYVTSMRPLRLMSSKTDSASPYVSISTSLFRRGFRLYMPVAVITLITMMAAYFSFFDFMRPYMLNMTLKHEYFPGPIGRAHPKGLDTLYEQLTTWVTELSQMMNIFSFEQVFPNSDGHLWTILIEFRSTLYLYIALLALARTRLYFRLLSLVLLSIYCLYWERWETTLFFWGACLAQVDVLRQEHQQDKQQLPQIIVSEPLEDTKPPTPPSANSSKRRTFNPFQSLAPASDLTPHPSDSLINRLWRTHIFSNRARLPYFTTGPSLRTILGHLTWTALFALSFFLLSAPTYQPESAPFYITLNEYLPQPLSAPTNKFWIPSLGAIGILSCLMPCSPSDRVMRYWFNAPWAQYLGKVMFAFYLVHGPVLHVGGYWLPHLVWEGLLGWEGIPEDTGAYVLGLGLGWMGCLGLVLWGADVFHREVVEKSVYVIYWFEGFVFVKG